MKQITQFLKEVRVELSKVEWPKTDEFLGAISYNPLFYDLLCDIFRFS